MSDAPIQLTYDRGTVVVTGGPQGFNFQSLPGVLFDPRTSTHRAQGRHYRAIVEQLIREKLPYTRRRPRLAQRADRLEAQRRAHAARLPDAPRSPRGSRRTRGVVVMPTGTGKTFAAFLCIEKVGRPTLVVTPKIDLMVQWAGELERAFGVEVGMVGAGEFNYQPLTVTTYDSAYIHLERWANRFGLVIFDECHHLPGASLHGGRHRGPRPVPPRPDRHARARRRRRCTAPRTGRPDRLPARHHRRRGRVPRPLRNAPGVHRPDAGRSRRRTATCREEYRRFVAERNISMSGRTACGGSSSRRADRPRGCKAIRAYREQKRIVQAASGKFKLLEELLDRHATDRMLIFTADNATVYSIARRYLIPAMTNQTKPKERKAILERFHAGEYTAVVTCQVLNEGVDVPAAGVGIVLGGTGSATENVQRLGRILRKHGDKQAVLYEVIAQQHGRGVRLRPPPPTPGVPVKRINHRDTENTEDRDQSRDQKTEIRCRSLISDPDL